MLFSSLVDTKSDAIIRDQPVWAVELRQPEPARPVLQAECLPHLFQRGHALYKDLWILSGKLSLDKEYARRGTSRTAHRHAQRSLARSPFYHTMRWWQSVLNNVLFYLSARPYKADFYHTVYDKGHVDIPTDNDSNLNGTINGVTLSHPFTPLLTGAPAFL